MKTYILDTNIVIKLWREIPYIFDLLENTPDTDYKVTNDAICELANGEIYQFFPKVLYRYQRVIKHIINNPISLATKPDKENRFIARVDNQLYYIVGNKVSSVDYGTIMLCQHNPEFFLVTDDKKMLKNAKLVLSDSQVLNYENFISELRDKDVNSGKGLICRSFDKNLLL